MRSYVALFAYIEKRGRVDPYWLLNSNYFLSLNQATKNPFYLHVGMDILQSLEKYTKAKLVFKLLLLHCPYC